jgi:hypothetical protein
MLFILSGFYEMAEEPDFWSPFIRKKRAKQNRFWFCLALLMLQVTVKPLTAFPPCLGPQRLWS